MTGLTSQCGVISIGLENTSGLSLNSTENLRIKAKEADPRRKGSRQFYFATQDAFDLKHPEALLKHIWRTPADPELYSLLDGRDEGGGRD